MRFYDTRKSSPVDPEPAQMTIFYAGKMSVFNGFPADKAKEIMALATKGSSLSTDGCPSSTPAMIKVKSSNSVAALDSNKGQETLQLQSQPNVSGKKLCHNLLVNSRAANDFRTLISEVIPLK